jgi:hypothetical protein
VFNASTDKTVEIFAIRVLNTGADQGTIAQVWKVTSNPGLGTLVTPTNNKFDGDASSMTCSKANSGVSITGTLLVAGNTNTNSTIELLPPGVRYILSSTTGIAVSVSQGGSGGNVVVAIVYAEYE